jgi:phenylpyruvate tautomerase PptA (4-oxalocrotonate tautomerase family)
MPNIILKTPRGAFTRAARDSLAQAVTEVARVVEQGGDAPTQAALTWVLIEEYEPGAFYAGGHDPLSRIIPVVVFFHYPQGVLDDAARAEAVRALQYVISAAKASDDPRQVMTSVIMSEVPDGTWGGNGGVWRLPDLARVAGYKHLQHLVAA